MTFTNNVVRHTGSGVNVLGRDDAAPSGPTRRLAIRNNIFDDVGGSRWGGGGRLLQLLNGHYRLARSSRYTRAATDGKDVGVEFSEGQGGLP